MIVRHSRVMDLVIHTLRRLPPPVPLHPPVGWLIPIAVHAPDCRQHLCLSVGWAWVSSTTRALPDVARVTFPTATPAVGAPGGRLRSVRGPRVLPAPSLPPTGASRGGTSARPSAHAPGP